MKRKKYLHTKFLKFLIESEKQAQKENDENESDEQEIQDVEIQDETNADEIIESLIQRQKNISKEFDDILHGRTRK
jgi:uncharacterized membrane protein